MVTVQSMINYFSDQTDVLQTVGHQFELIVQNITSVQIYLQNEANNCEYSEETLYFVLLFRFILLCFEHKIHIR